MGKKVNKWFMSPTWFIKRASKDSTIGYFTFNDSESELNSKHSWESWGDESTIINWEIKPEEGYRISGLNSRWSNSAKNSEPVLVMHPCGIEFEVSQSELLKIIKTHTIINGVIQGKLIGGRGLVSEKEFNDMRDEFVTEQKRVANIVKTKPKDFKKGEVYQVYANCIGKFIGFSNHKSLFTSDEKPKEKAIFLEIRKYGNMYLYVKPRCSLEKVDVKFPKPNVDEKIRFCDCSGIGKYPDAQPRWNTHKSSGIVNYYMINKYGVDLKLTEQELIKYLEIT